MATKFSSTSRTKSRYSVGGVPEIFNNRLGWWERTIYTKSDDDIKFTITPRFSQRPDLIAYNVYQDTELEWLVLQYNNIVDVQEELSIGKVISLPSYSRTTSITSRKSSNL